MAAVSGALRAFRHPRLWVGVWGVLMVAVVVVCLGPPPEIPELPRNSDKAEHFLTYFGLAFWAVQLFATRRALLWAGFGLVLLGVGIEFAQGAFTVDRSADPFDALANTLGVVAGLSFARTPAREWLSRFDRRVFGGRTADS
ncbi:VanZ family protein [Stenotrophomonas sp. HITSZ_GD]|uniref:VanZ family protein n=1 Tax=Stenotrophomonas sp. HITSZ_GD TaxID=3037248 RepID=UPI00240DDF71|nr:VanZ family protein [Stenotrophomonas sp. HITSZ_GD]MDG2525970.1 VanZ family protein [Stenotrophomonas sp. HITSZ_GD]